MLPSASHSQKRAPLERQQRDFGRRAWARTSCSIAFASLVSLVVVSAAAFAFAIRQHATPAGVEPPQDTDVDPTVRAGSPQPPVTAPAATDFATPLQESGGSPLDRQNSPAARAGDAALAANDTNAHRSKLVNGSALAAAGAATIVAIPTRTQRKLTSPVLFPLEPSTATYVKTAHGENKAFDWGGGRVYMHAPHGGDNQMFYVEAYEDAYLIHLVSEGAGKCLDWDSDNSKPVLGDCHMGSNQQWYFDGEAVSEAGAAHMKTKSARTRTRTLTRAPTLATPRSVRLPC